MYSPDLAHAAELRQKPILAFDETQDFEAQRQAVSQRFLTLLGRMPEKVPLNPQVEYTRDMGSFTEHRIVFDTEQDVKAVCLLCIPKLGKEKYPLAICLQGHSTGMHISMERAIYEGDLPNDGDRDFALQALERGYAALCLEQRGMGERRTAMSAPANDDGHPRCHITAMNALLLGRTMIGERCWDVSRAIDLALTYPEIDPDRILCTGNSGGGTTTYYASCFDPRIRVSMPSCAVCTYKDSIGAMLHCVCNFIPGIARYVDMGDLAQLIAPRYLILIHGDEDPIFPSNGVLETYETVKKIYTAAGVPGNCALATGHGGHRYYKKEAWEAFDQLAAW